MAPLHLDQTKSRRRALLFGLFCLLFSYSDLLLSLIRTPGADGPLDWHLEAGMLEAFRKTVLEFGQFPWWNPYSVGGFPYFANSLTPGVFSLPAALTLLIGALPAVKVSILVFSCVGFLGMYRLAGRVTPDPLYRAAAAVVFSCNGGIVMHLCVGHLFLDYFLYPWIICLLVEVNSSPSSRKALYGATAAGAILGIAAQSFIHYGFIYTLLTVAALFARGLWQWRKGREGRFAVVLNYGLFAAVFLAIGGSRLYLCSIVMHDFPRVERFEVSSGVGRLIRLLVLPGQTIRTTGGDPLGWWEWGCYVGVCAFAVFLYSARKKREAYHWAVPLGGLMFIYTRWPAPYYWLSHYVPLFQSMRVPPRIRIWMMPYFALGVASGLTLLNAKRGRWAMLLSVVIMLDVGANSFYTLHQAFGEKIPTDETAKNYQNQKPYPVVFHDREYGFNVYQSLLRGWTYMPGYEPAVSDLLYSKNPATLPLKGVNDPDYKGAFYTDQGPVEPRFWSPNRIEFEGVTGALHLNMNLGSYWQVNGRDLYSDLRVSEVEEAFVVQPDSRGRVVLQVVPKGLELALLLSGVSCLVAVGLGGWLWRPSAFGRV